MGFPDVQDGRPPRGGVGAELPPGPAPAEMPDEDTTGYRRGPTPTAEVPSRETNGGGSRPAGRPGAHRAAPGSEAGARAARPDSRPVSPGSHRARTGRQDQPTPPSRPVGDGHPSLPSRPVGDGHPSSPGRPVADAGAWPTGSATTGPQARPRRPARPRRSADGMDEDGGLAITREAPGTRRSAAAQAGPHPPSPGPGGPLRGFPPAPGQADPVYPPGQFSPWNRPSTRAAWLGIAARGGGAIEAEPGYSALAVSDAAADLTSTQTWAVIDEEPPPSPSLPVRTGHEWASHTGEPPWQRTANGRTLDSQARVAGLAPGPGRPSAGTDDLATGAGLLGGPATGPPDLGGPATGPQGPRGAGLPGAGERRAPGSRIAARQVGARSAGAAAGPQAPTALGQATGPQAPTALGQATGPQAPTAFGEATGPQAPTAFGGAERGRRSRGAVGDAPLAGGRGAPGGRGTPGGREAPESRGASDGRRAGRRGRRSTAMMAGILLAPVLVVVVVVAGYVYFSGKRAPAPAHPAASSHPTATQSSPPPTLGPWKHIESRSQDPAPLTIHKLFPAKFSRNGASGTLAITRAGTRCSREVFGTKLAAAIRKGKCTQVLRASYLSTDRKIMATVGVLNLKDVTAAEKAGKAAGATQFIKQLPSAHGPTRNLAKGTGIEVAEVKGHYLILIWTEFANLHAPSGKSQRQKLESFSVGLVAGTANISLSNRMVTGHP